MALGLVLTAAGAAHAEILVVCREGVLPQQALRVGGGNAPGRQPDLEVTGRCLIDQDGDYFYGQVNVKAGGQLVFTEPTRPSKNGDINFWASSIVIENGGSLTAGAPGGKAYGDPSARSDRKSPTLTFYIYGADRFTWGRAENKITAQNQGALCKSTGAAPCGIPTGLWSDNGATLIPGCGADTGTTSVKCLPGLPTGVMDYFYQYAPIYGDGQCKDGEIYQNGKCGTESADGKVGYFGAKTFAVSFGGSLVLNGYKGASPTSADAQPTNSGVSWTRLAADLAPGATSLTLAKAPGERWQRGDEIVVTTTDYLPAHSEQFVIDGVDGNTVTFHNAARWYHNGTPYKIGLGSAKERLLKKGMDPVLVGNGAETRAAVALLTRSIRIVSAGDAVNEFFPALPSTYAYGAQFIVRQGVLKVNIQGVEFRDMGVGGRIGHYPVHIHKARMLPPNTYVKDSSINVSNTRWVAVHSTQNLTVQRDVGWKSIGHGYYLEDGTEANNNFYSDLGIFARAAIPNDRSNPRRIPGILADNQDPASFTKANKDNVANPGFPYRSDNEYPTVFWISNGWNNFQGDMAAGAGACGSAYWFAPFANSDTPDVPTATNVYVEPGPPPVTTNHMKWADGGVDSSNKAHFGYAGLQRLPTFAAATPLESFYKNYATSTMMSFQTTADAPACDGFIAADAQVGQLPVVKEIASDAPKPARKTVPLPTPHTVPDLVNDPYYPHVIGLRQATRCPKSQFLTGGYDCSPPGPGQAGLRTPCTDATAFLIANPGKIDDPNNPMVPCAVTVLDHFTSSFHWAQGNVSAIWLRPQWYLVTNSVISDVQQGGITFVTGGDVTRSSIITGYWGLSRDSILVGHTQPQSAEHAFARDIGPFNKNSMLACDPQIASDQVPPYCLSKAEGVSLPLSGFFDNQRLENIYDGPSYRDANAYLDVKTAHCEPGSYDEVRGTCIYGAKNTSGILKDLSKPAGQQCYLPNAAIAWKQPNGFFYPPAFHADDLYFGMVDIRHFVIDPLFKAFDGSTAATGDFGQGGSYLTDQEAVKDAYCLPPGAALKTYFGGFTSIDRQTELNDDDGTLTGLSNSVTAPSELKQTISVNDDDFFTAPVETPECASNLGANVKPENACTPPNKNLPTVTAKTSPYDYVSTVIYHTAFGGVWDPDCTNPTCYGVPLYRQYLAGNDAGSEAGSTREWKHWYRQVHGSACSTNISTPQCRWPYIRMAGTAFSTRETLTVNNGTYYIDTTVPADMQRNEVYNTENGGKSLTANVNVFLPPGDINGSPFDGTYNVFFVYAKPTTRQTYQIYLGPNGTDANIKPIQVRLNDLVVTTLAPSAWLSAQVSGGIATVTVDFTKLTDDSLQTVPSNGLCQPRTFCTGTTSCGSALSDTDPLVIADPDMKRQAEAVCKTWAVKDLDCPPKGCYGFSFTMPAGFAPDATIASPSPHRPQPGRFPSDDSNQGQPNWLVQFLNTDRVPDNGSGGQCYYPKIPGSADCPVP